VEACPKQITEVSSVAGRESKEPKWLDSNRALYHPEIAVLPESYEKL
jgi:hypothetical protein